MAHRNPPDSGTASLIESYPQLPATTPFDVLTDIPEEQVWLASRKSPQSARCHLTLSRVHRHFGITPDAHAS